jgi:hypothetical protein
MIDSRSSRSQPAGTGCTTPLGGGEGCARPCRVLQMPHGFAVPNTVVDGGPASAWGAGSVPALSEKSVVEMLLTGPSWSKPRPLTWTPREEARAAGLPERIRIVPVATLGRPVAKPTP